MRRVVLGLLLVGLSGCGVSSEDSIGATSQAVTAPAWQPGVAYSADTWVSHGGRIYRVIQAHTSQTGGEPPNVPALYADEGVDTGGSGGNSSGGSSGSGGSGSQLAEITLDALTLGVDCNAKPERCCLQGSTRVTLTPADDTFTSTTVNQCILALTGRDTVALHSTGRASLFLGEGDDTSIDGSGDSVIFGGPGSDTIHGYGGTDWFFGNSGNDVLHASQGNNHLIPGPGLDTASAGNGNDTFYIFDVCEITSGETLDGGGGTDTLVTPVPLAELTALGVTISNIENIVVEANSCRSECFGTLQLPACTGNLASTTGACRDGVCCPEDARNLMLSSSADSCVSATAHRCVLAEGGNDILRAPLSGVSVYYQGGDGDDVLRGGGGDDLLNGNSGHDMLCSASPGSGRIVGGAGNDTISTTAGAHEVYPGAGRDKVMLGGQGERVIIAAPCEVEPGESYRAQGGAIEIFSPLTRVELEALGATFQGEFIFTLTRGIECFATCGGNPGCALDDTCHVEEVGGPVLCASPRTQLNGATPPRQPPGYPNAPAHLRELLDAYHAAANDSDAALSIALRRLRVRASEVVPLVVTEYASTPVDMTDWRLSQVQLLAYVDAALVFPHLQNIARSAIPADTGLASHMDPPQTKEVLIRAAAISGLGRLARLHLAEAESELRNIMANNSDHFLREKAALAYLAKSRTAAREAEVRSLLPASQSHVATISVRSNGFPQPPHNIRP